MTASELAAAFTIIRIATAFTEEFQDLTNRAVKVIWKLSGEFSFDCPHCQSRFDNPIEAKSHIARYQVIVSVWGVYFK